MGEKRKSISKRIRFEVFKRDKFTCQYCGRSTPDVVLEVDHIKPVSKGGDNNMLNLITSCKDCNLGKSNVELSDDTRVMKERKQLAELAERKEQLEMYANYRTSLLDMQNDEVEYLADFFETITGKGVLPYGKEKLAKWVSKFGYKEVFDAIEIAVNQYEDDAVAFDKIGGICFNRKNGTPEEQRWFCYIRKAMLSKGFYVNVYLLRADIKKHIKTQVDFENAKDALSECRNWSQFREWIENYESGVSADGD